MQVKPSPVEPVGHVQVRVKGAIVSQSALRAQPPLLVVHRLVGTQVAPRKFAPGSQTHERPPLPSAVHVP